MALKLIMPNLSASSYINKIVGMSGDEDCLYVRISQQSGDAKYCVINLTTYAIKDESIIGDYSDVVMTAINNQSYSFTPELDGDNFIRQGYNYLKTLPEFEGFEDC